MLELVNIKKDYYMGDNTVHALKGVSLKFRKSEFVSILGPSGCGKTTMLNIIGGLDGYTAGDLIINGRSTKKYSDRDWDSYRNHSVGFVFQSYNLIPHQSVLQNVELALTLTGIPKAERRKRAIDALIRVGLGDQMRKKPLLLSGGQMQRVAIARAIVNDPDIILADEPTGALDTETSVQVMEILKEISKERLVVMVTHNPELAEKYSTRIIKMLDGEIKSDSEPISYDEYLIEMGISKKNMEIAKNEKKPKMKLWTSFGLSMRNLITKKGRTALTSFAGSIGIIGIALIFAVSQGMTNYINTVQEDTLASYPLTIESQHMDVGALLQSFMGKAQENISHETDAVYQNSSAYEFINVLNSTETRDNDLQSFKKFIEAELEKGDDESVLKNALNGVQYTYNMDLLIYTKDEDGRVVDSDINKLMQDILLEHFGMNFSSMMDSFGGGMSMGFSTANYGSGLWQEILSGNDGALVSDLVKKQYDVLYGSWPTKYNEIVLIVDKNNEIDDMTLYALGLKTKEEMDAIVNAAKNKEDIVIDSKSWSYKDICDREFRAVLGHNCYVKDEKTGLFVDLRKTDTGIKMLYEGGTVLEVSGIVRINEDATAGMLNGTIGYTSALTKYMIEKAKESPAVQVQLADPTTDIFTGLPFKSNTGLLEVKEKSEAFGEYIDKLDNESRAQTYIDIMSIAPKENVDEAVNGALSQSSREDIENTLVPLFASQTGMSNDEIVGYVEKMTEDDLRSIYAQIVAEGARAKYAENVKKQLGSLDKAQLVYSLDEAMKTFTDEQRAEYYDNVLKFSDAEYDGNLRKLGHVDLSSPSTINLYTSSFANKDVMVDAISDYNDGVEESQKIFYTDFVGIMMSSITTIINAITYVLIAFVAVSLVVSSIMIGVITLISVQERTKEIGILRAIGASKKNVSRMFNAETVMIGFASGILGVGITYLLSIVINIILHAVTGIDGLNAYLPLPVAVVLVVISVLLTLIAGVIPSRSAAKKDPVVALRSE